MQEVYIYPHPFLNSKYERVWNNIINKNNDKLIDFVIMTNTIKKIIPQEVFHRCDLLYEKYKDKKIKVVAMGYSPLVSIVTYWAFVNGLEVVYFIENQSQTDFEERVIKI
jgi:hypothetical protein